MTFESMNCGSDQATYSPARLALEPSDWRDLPAGHRLEHCALMTDPGVHGIRAGTEHAGYESPSLVRRMYYRLSRRRADSLLQTAIELHKSGDRQRALETVRRSASLGNSQACYHLGVALIAGDVIPQDLKQALSWFRRSAVLGHLPSMQTLGRLYATGDGVPKHVALAVMWFEQAALRGDAVSQLALGLLYFEGNDVPADDHQAVRWLRQSAEQGQASACSALGICFENGRGVRQDLSQAFSWQLRAAHLGDTIGQYNVGRHYFEGIGTTVDLASGAIWFSRAAEGGDADGQFNLGRCFLSGNGVAQDPYQAVRWFAAAAAQGHAMAKIYWAGVLADGTTGPPDRTQALRLLDEAEAAGLAVDHIRPAILETAPPDHADPFAGLREAFASGPGHEAEDIDFRPNLFEDKPDQPTPFCRATCFFAFHLLPDWIFGAHQPTSPVTATLLKARLPELWSEAALLGQASNANVSVRNQLPSCREEPPWHVIELAGNGLPPEPHCLLINLSTFPAAVVLVERFLMHDERGGLMCSISERQEHAVLGLLHDRTAAMALAVGLAPGRPHSLPTVGAAILMRHLTLYAEVQADLTRGRGMPRK